MGRGIAPGDHLSVDIWLAAVHLADLLPGRRVDPDVVVVRLVTVPGQGLSDHDPRVGVAEDASVLFVACWIR